MTDPESPFFNGTPTQPPQSPNGKPSVAMVVVATVLAFAFQWAILVGDLFFTLGVVGGVWLSFRLTAGVALLLTLLVNLTAWKVWDIRDS